MLRPGQATAEAPGRAVQVMSVIVRALALTYMRQGSPQFLQVPAEALWSLRLLKARQATVLRISPWGPGVAGVPLGGSCRVLGAPCGGEGPGGWCLKREAGCVWVGGPGVQAAGSRRVGGMGVEEARRVSWDRKRTLGDICQTSVVSSIKETNM